MALHANTYVANAGGSLQVSGQGSYPIRGVIVDNYTSQWLLVNGYHYVQPYTSGYTLPLDGAGTVNVTSSAPPQFQQNAIIAGEQFVVTLSPNPVLFSSGSTLPPALTVWTPVFALSQGRVSPGAGAPNDVIPAGAIWDGIQGQGGAKRTLVQALSANVASVWLKFSAAVLLSSAGGVELKPGAAVVIPYPWLSRGTPANPIPPGAPWAQFWWDGAADLVSLQVMI